METVAVSLVIAYMARVVFKTAGLLWYAPPVTLDKLRRAFLGSLYPRSSPIPRLISFWLVAAAVFAVLQWGAKWRH